MFYYRYRNCSEISLKELLYSEIYFSSPEECNDPFDCKPFHVFDADRQKWHNLLRFAVEHTNATLTDTLLHSLTEYLVKKCPLTYEEATSKHLFDDYNVSSSYDGQLVVFIAKRIQDIIDLYRPVTKYFASFSTDGSEPLMWSHYADKHKGFCLVFRAIGGALNQDPDKKKTNISMRTENGIAPQMSYGIPESFSFLKIDYEPEVKQLDAFFNLPEAISKGLNKKEDEERLVKERGSHYTQKSKRWEYESEYRLMLSTPISWLFGAHFDFTKQERLFHYQPSQLVGIIYGARMEASEKLRIQQILQDRRNWRTYPPAEKTMEFSFVEYEATLSANQRDVVVAPIGLLSYKTIPATDPNFERLYKELLDGWGWERTQNGSRRLKVE